MSTLVLRDAPEELHQRLKESAAVHHRSMTKEAIVILKEALAHEPAAMPKPTWDEFAKQMEEFWAMPIFDDRLPDDIIGYDEHGLPR